MVLAELIALEAELQEVVLPLELAGAGAARDAVRNARQQLRDYLIPRFEQWNAPIIVVVGGSTGAGKSTLVNAIVGEEVSPASAIRPTTRVPVLVHHPEDSQWFHTARLLPRWVRDASSGDGAAPPGSDPTIKITSSRHLPAGLALIDAPDIDSLDQSNRRRAQELLAAADAWIFVTTAMRYADAVPWEYLRGAQERNAVVMLVLGRTPPGHAAEVSADLRRLLAAEGLGRAPVHPITEKTAPPIVTGEEIAPITRWLESLIAPDARDDLVRQTAVGATAHLLARVEEIAAAVAAQESAASALAHIVDAHHGTDPIHAALQDGVLLRGEVLRQWHEFLGTGEYARRLEAGVGRARDMLRRLWRRPAEGNLKEELGQGFTALLLATAAEAARGTYDAWNARPGGGDLLRADLALPSPELPERTREQMEQWQAGVLDLVRTHGAGKRTGARIAAFGVNAIAVLLMVVAFASTGGLVGAEVAIAGGAAVVAQRLLEAIFGEHGVRQLAAEAQEDLLRRAHYLLAGEAERYHARIPAVPGPHLHEAGAQVDRALGELG